MPPVFDPFSFKTHLPGYTTSSLNHGSATGFYGSTFANQFIKDVVSGRDSLDVIVVGDSNSGFTQTGGSSASGFTYAWEKGLIDAGAAPYATAVYTCAASAASNTVEGKTSTLQVDGFNHRSAGQSGGSSFVTLGSASGISAITDQWNSGSGNLRPTAVGLDWAYTAAGTNQQSSLFVEIKSASALGITSAFVYRIVYGTFATGSGAFSLLVHNSGGSPLYTSPRISTNTGVSGTSVYELSIPAEAGRTGNIRFCREGGNYTALTVGVTGPCGFLCESVYKRVKGFAVTCMSYFSGGTSEQVKNGVVNSNNTIKTYLKEMRERQVAAGGTGRVLVTTTTGANDGGNVGNWATHTNSMVAHFRTKWHELGYPQSDLAFVVMVSHPQAAVDGMAAGRTAAKANQLLVERDCTFIDLSEALPYSYLNANTLYDTAGNAHLKTTGYAELGSRVISGLLK